LTNTNPNPIIYFKDISFINLCLILKYMYTGEVEMARNRLAGFLESCKSLGVADIPSASAPNERPAANVQVLIEDAVPGTGTMVTLESLLERAIVNEGDVDQDNDHQDNNNGSMEYYSSSSSSEDGEAAHVPDDADNSDTTEEACGDDHDEMIPSYHPPSPVEPNSDDRASLLFRNAQLTLPRTPDYLIGVPTTPFVIPSQSPTYQVDDSEPSNKRSSIPFGDGEANASKRVRIDDVPEVFGIQSCRYCYKRLPDLPSDLQIHETFCVQNPGRSFDPSQRNIFGGSG